MGAFPFARAVRIRRRAAAVSLSMLALAGVFFGGTTTAQASDRAAAGPAGTGCPRPVTGGTVTASATVSSAAWTAAGRSRVPWHSVGRGWILADLAKSMSASGPGTLYLVSPGGQRYRLGQGSGERHPSRTGRGTARTRCSSPRSRTRRRRRSSCSTCEPARPAASRCTPVTPYPAISFSRPDGTAILFQAGASPDGGFLPLQRFSLTGALELCYPTQFPQAGAVDGGYLENASGTELVFNTQNGLEVVSNAGQPIRALATHGPDACSCWTGGTTRACWETARDSCWPIPLSGGRPDQLTSSRDDGTFLGAWHIPSGTYAEAAACGSTWLEKLNSNGTATILTIPGAADAGTVQPLGTYGNQLPLLVGGGCDGHYPYSFVDWYKPSTNVAKTVSAARQAAAT